MKINWLREFEGAITICDNEGIIIYMNDKSIKTFEKDGGKNLIGKSLLDCHTDESKNKLKDLLDNKRLNVNTIEKDGEQKLIYQTPWYENRICKGLIELSLPIPAQLPHFKRN
jgi:transcriptional regulator with PAS, ATPase and Fis domain